MSRGILTPPLENAAALHYEVHVLQLRDVGHGIGGDSHDVGELARLQRSNLVLHVQQFGCAHVRRMQRLRRRHAVLHHEGKFFGRVDRPLKAASVGAECDLHAGRQCALEGSGMNADHFQPDVRAFAGATSATYSPTNSVGT